MAVGKHRANGRSEALAQGNGVNDMDRRVVTVFGGAGFIGRHLVQRLAAEGAIVRVAVRDAESALFLKPLGDPGQIVAMALRIDDADAVANAVRGADAVVNLVGILTQGGRQTFQKIHVDGARTVAEAARDAGVSRLVHVSAVGADPASEARYARTKAAGEEAAAAFPGATIVRPSLVVGPEDKFFNFFAALARISPWLPVIGGGRTRFQPVYVVDVAHAIAKALADPETAGKTFELGGPRVYSFKELLEIMLRETRRTRLLLPVPFALASFEAWFLEKLPVPLLTRDQVRMLRHDNVVSEGALGLRDLGVEPTAIEVVVPTYLHRYRAPSMQSLRPSN